MQAPPIRHQWTADNGMQVTIRPITATDRDIELAFVRGLSPDSRYFRFLSTIKDLTPQLLDRFTQVDFPREMALIATIPTSTGEQEIGVARYAKGNAPGTVEFAIVIADTWQGQGIGRELLRHLFNVAEEVGHRRIEGVALKANTKMLRLARELRFEIDPYPGDASLVRLGKDIQSRSERPAMGHDNLTTSKTE